MTPRTCPVEDCGGELVWATEITAACPFGTGAMIEICDTCGEPTGRSYWVGH